MKPRDGDPTQRSHAFISYVREDRRRVDRLQELLEARGIPVWRDTAQLWPGENWRAKIQGAIADDSLAFIACFSNNSEMRVKSYQRDELLLAIEQLRLRSLNTPYLLPVRFDDCPIPDFDIGAGRTLNSLQRADLFGKGRSANVEQLIQSIQRIVGPAPANLQGLREQPDIVITAAHGSRVVRPVSFRRLSRTQKFIIILVTVVVIAGIFAFISYGGNNPGTGRPGSEHGSNSAGPSSASGSSSHLVLHDPDSLGVRSVAFTSGGEFLAAGDGNGHSYVWQLPGGTHMDDMLDPASSGVNAVAFSPDGSLLAAGDSNGHVYLWAHHRAGTLSSPAGGEIESVAFAPDGKMLAGGDSNGHTYLWSLTTKNVVANFLDPSSHGVRSVAFDPSADLLAVGNRSGRIVLFELPGDT